MSGEILFTFISLLVAVFCVSMALAGLEPADTLKLPKLLLLKIVKLRRRQ